MFQNIVLNIKRTVWPPNSLPPAQERHTSLKIYFVKLLKSSNITITCRSIRY